MIEVVLAALLVIAVVCGCMWLNSASPFIFAFLIGCVVGAGLAIAVCLWLFARGGER